MVDQSFLALLSWISTLAVRIPSYLVLRWIPGPWALPLSVLGSITHAISVGLSQPNNPDVSVKALAGNDSSQSKAQKTSKPRSWPWTFVRTMLLGIPDSEQPTLTFISLGINILLACSVLDMTLRPALLYPSDDLRFSRVGFVSSDTAKILIREPGALGPTLPLELVYYPSSPGVEYVPKKVLIKPVDESTDYTAAVVLSDLQSDTQYRYSVSNNLEGSFTTMPSAGSPQADRLSFVTSSCIKANWPYNPRRHPLAFPGFSHLAKVLDILRSPASFMLFLGDFIYVDVPARLGSSVEHYRSEYRRVYASPSWSLSPALKALPWIHTLDDHEIENDWSSGNATAPFLAASDPFELYHASVNPPIPQGTTPDNTTYYSFTQGPASFFMVETRRYRSHPEPHPNATILGKRQLEDLLAFISRPEPEQVKWKMIVSSVPFTKNWQVGTKDTWGGFLEERAIVLEAMQNAETNLGVRVVILSGDRHEFGAVRFPRVGAGTSTSGPHEYCVGPLSQFYLPVRAFKQKDDQDVVIKYLPDGNSKVGHIEITNGKRGKGTSLLQYTLYIDGQIAWEHILTSPAPEYILSH